VRRAHKVMAQLDAVGTHFHFIGEDHLEREIRKRVETALIMEITQSGPGKRAFGYPFDGPARLYGPRVNYAAREYWEPHPPDGYNRREGDAIVKALMELPRGQRHLVFADQPAAYEFRLTDKGYRDFHSAVMTLFTPQQRPERRALIHCDRLVSLVHLRVMARQLGRAEFNRRAQQMYPDNLKLDWNLFMTLDFENRAQDDSGAENPLASLRRVELTREEDLIIGDHVMFLNHSAFDVINHAIGNAWRLENAVVVDRRNGQNIFLGHGSGKKTERQLRNRLALEYNKVVDKALALTRQIDRGGKAGKRAQAELVATFPSASDPRRSCVEKDADGRWVIAGEGFKDTRYRVSVRTYLRKIGPDNVNALRNPTDPSVLVQVFRPSAGPADWPGTD
jgi:hypothetical protein